MRLISCSFLLITACSPLEPSPVTLHQGSSPAIDLATVQAGSTRLWQPSEEGARTGQPTWRAASDEAGRVTITGVHTPAGRELHPIESTPTRLGPSRLRRGRSWDASRPSFVAEPQQVSFVGQGVTERWRNVGVGLEQRWDFPRAPAGRGDLIVEVPVEGATFRSAAPDGLHLRCGALGLRYGHGLWVDATGRSSHVPAAFVNGVIVLRVPAETLDATAYPAVLDPLVGPEFDPTTPLVGPASFTQQGPRLATSGPVTLAVWANLQGSQGDVYGARIDANGQVLDVPAFPIASSAFPERAPDVAFDGTRFLVVWEIERRVTTGFVESHDVAGAFVTPQAAVGASFTISLTFGSPSARDQRSPRVVFADGLYLVAWTDFRNYSTVSMMGEAVFGARVTPAGVVLDDRGGFAIGGRARVDLTTLGPDFLVSSSTSGSTPFLRLVRPDAGVVTPPGLTGAASAAAVASGAGVGVVAWSSFAGLFASRLSDAGAPLGPVVTLASTPGGSDLPVAAFDGTNFWLGWSQLGDGGRELLGVRLSPEGALLDATPRTLFGGPEDEQPTDLLPVGATMLLGFNRTSAQRTTDEDALLQRYDLSMQPLGPVVRVSSGVNATTNPAAAFDGTQWFAVWEDARLGVPAIVGSRISPSGVPLDPGGLVIEPGPAVGPSIAFDGTSFVVAWTVETGLLAAEVRARKVTASGSVGPVLVVGPGFPPDRATAHFDGANTLVAWRGGFRRISPQGQLVEAAPVPFGAGGGLPLERPSMASTRSGITMLTFNTRLYRLINGAVQPPLTGRALTGSGHALGSDGEAFLLVWSSSPDLEAAQLPADGGALGPPFLASNSTRGERSTSVTFDGRSFLVAWEGVGLIGTPLRVEVSRVTTDGRTSDLPGVAVGDGGLSEERPVAVGGRDGVLLMYDVTNALPAPRFRARLLDTRVPLTFRQVVTTPEDTPVSVTLQALDPLDGGLTFTLEQLPTRGALTGVAPALVYTPQPDVSGPDSFTWRVSNGAGSSEPVLVSITVTSQPDPPVARPQRVVTPFRTPVVITLTATDPDSTVFTFAVSSPVTQGTLLNAPPTLTYVPPANFVGSAFFSFTANDGQLTSMPAVVEVVVLGPDGGLPPDAGLPDAGGLVDAGSPVDAGGAVDAGVVDGGLRFDGGADGGVAPDAGVEVDGGVVDDGGLVVDAGVGVDGGVVDDGGLAVDAGVEVDGGVADDGGLAVDEGGGDTDGGAGAPVEPVTGCACSQVDGSTLVALALLLAVWARRSQTKVRA